MLRRRFAHLFRHPAGTDRRTSLEDHTTAACVELLETRVLLAFPAGGEALLVSETGTTVGTLTNGDTLLTWVDGGDLFRQTFSPDGTPRGAAEDLGPTAGTPLAVGPDGTVVTFRQFVDNSVSPSAEVIEFQRFAAGGTAGAVTTLIASDSGSVRLDGSGLDAAGNLYALITDESGGSSEAFVFRFDAADNFLGSLQVSGEFEAGLSLTVFEDGTHVATYTGYDFLNDRELTLGRVYNADGTPAGDEFELAEGTVIPMWGRSGTGALWATWADGSRVRVRRFSAVGVPLASASVVSTEADSVKSAPRIAVSDDGTAVIVWASAGQEGTSGDLGTFGRVVNADGTPIGPEFLANESAAGEQTPTHVLLTSEEAFVVLWSGDGESGSGTYTRSFTVTDVPPLSATEEVPVSAETVGDQSRASVAVNASGQTVIAWQAPGSGGDLDVFAQIYDAGGVPVGDVITVASGAGDQSLPSVAIDETGRFVIVWQQDDGDGLGIFGQRFFAGGNTFRGRFRANTETAGDQAFAEVAVGAAGTFTIVWQSVGQDGSGAGVYAQRYVDDVRTGAEFRVNDETFGAQYAPDVAVDGRGVSTFVWADSNRSAIYAKQYDDSGTEVAPEFRVARWTNFDGVGIAMPTVGANASGQFVIAWMQAEEVRGERNVIARRYLADGTPFGEQFDVASNIFGQQQNPDVALDDRGNFVVAWMDSNDGGGSGNGWGVSTRFFYSSGEGIGDTRSVNTFMAGDQMFPSVGLDASGRAVVAWQSAGQDGDGFGVYARTLRASDQIDFTDVVARREPSTWRVGQSDGTQFVTSTFARWSTTQDWQTTQYADFNGDGRTDIASRANNGTWWVGLSNGSGLVTTSWSRWSTTADWRDIGVGDFNGDGRADVIGRAASGQWWIGYSDGTRFGTEAASRWDPAQQWRNTQYADFDGNGSDDVASRRDDGTWWVGRTQPFSGDFRFMTSAWGRWVNGTTWHDVTAADVNADGRVDILGRTDAGSWWVAFSNGSGFDMRSAGSWIDIGGTGGAGTFTLGDFDGDGYVDLGGFLSGVWYVSLYDEVSRRFGGSASVNEMWADWQSVSATWSDVVSGDFDGDGRSDVATRDENGNWQAGLSTGEAFTRSVWGNWSVSVTFADVGTGTF